MSHHSKAILFTAIGVVIFLGLAGLIINRNQTPEPVVPNPLIVSEKAPIKINKISGSATRLYVREKVVDKVDKNSAVEIAKKLIISNKDRLKGSASSDILFQFLPESNHQLVFSDITVSQATSTYPESYTVLFHQEESGIPVERTNLRVVLTANGELTTLGGDVYADFAMEIQPEISKDKAEELARKNENVGQNAPLDFRLSIMPPEEKNGPFRLFWLTRSHEGSPLFANVVRVDAMTGEVISTPIYHSQSPGGVLNAKIPHDNPTAARTDQPLPNASVTAGGTEVLTDANGQFSGTSPYSAGLSSPYVETYLVSECSNDLLNCNSDDLESGSGNLTFEASSTPLLGKLITYHAILNEHTAVKKWGFTKFTGKVLNVNRIPEMQTNQNIVHCNAFWSPVQPGYGLDSVIFTFLTGSDDPRGCPIAKDIETYSDVTYHEYGHGVMYHEYDPSTYPSTKEAGAISEGFADFMACTMNNDPVIAPLNLLNPDRSCASSYTYNNLITYCGSDPACHNGGAIIATALYQAEITQGVNKDSFMETIFRGMAQRPVTMKDFGDAVYSQTADVSIQNALVNSFAARGITLNGTIGVANCGDGVITSPEVCDGSNFGVKTCSSETGGSKPIGDLLCQNSCSTISTTTCSSDTGITGDLGPGTGGSGGAFPGQQTMTGSLGHSFTVYIPSSYNPSNPTALVMALPGQGGTANSVLVSGWRTIADRDNVIIATLQPVGANGGYDQPDVDTIFAALDEVPQKYNIAINHISIWGFSAGAHLTYAVGLASDGATSNAEFFNALAVQAGTLNTAKGIGVYPTSPNDRRVPIYLSVGSTDPMQATVQSDNTDLNNNGYTVEYRPISQGHTYTSTDVEAAWAFLKNKSLNGDALQPCTTNGCSVLNAVQCADSTNINVCYQKTENGQACLGYGQPSSCGAGNVCANTSSTTAACVPDSGSTSTSSSSSSSSSSIPTSSSSISTSSSSIPTSSSSIPAGTCGDGVKDYEEACDGNDLGNDDCITLGFKGGTLYCHEACRGFDVSQCLPNETAECGDGVLTPPEQCDDSNTDSDDGCSSVCEVERDMPGNVNAVFPSPMSVGVTGVPVSFDCRRSSGYNLACGWDFGDGSNSLGLADYDENGVVDLEDLKVMVNAIYVDHDFFGAPLGTSFDLNADGFYDIEDVQVLINQSNTHVAAHTYQAAGPYIATLTVSGYDPQGNSIVDVASGYLRVEQGAGGILIANAGQDQDADVGEEITLLGSAQGGTTPYTYNWSQISGLSVSLQDADQAVAHFNMPAAQINDPLVFRLEVSDSEDLTASDQVEVTGGLGEPGPCDLPLGKKIGVLQIGSHTFDYNQEVKTFFPSNPDDAYDTDTVDEVGQEFIDNALGTSIVDPNRLFIDGEDAGATSALLAGLPYDTQIAGIIHTDQETGRECVNSSCFNIQSMIVDYITYTDRIVPILITHQKDKPNSGQATVQFLLDNGYTEGVNLFVLETDKNKPDEETDTIVDWMLHQTLDNSCTEPGEITAAPTIKDSRNIFAKLLLPIANAAPGDIESSDCEEEGGVSCIEDDLEITPPFSRDAFQDLGMQKIASYLMSIVASVALLFTIYGGVLYITAGGDEERQLKARHIIYYSLAGLVMVALSYVIVVQVLKVAYTNG